MLQRAAHAIILSAGWRRTIYAFIAGVIGALAFAPIHFLPAFIIAMMMAVWLLDGCTGQNKNGRGSRLSALRVAAETGWWFGFGFFLTSLWWLGAAFLVEAEKFAWAIPLGVIGLPALLSFFTGLGFVLARILWSAGSARLFALAFGLGVAEWLRGTILSGFPWNDFGMVLGGQLVLAQLASITGLHGLTFIAIVLSASPATLIGNPDEMASSGGLMQWLRSASAPGILAALGLVAITVFGAIRLAGISTEFKKDVRLRIMQPNLPQDRKFKAENAKAILEHYIKVSDRSTSPETPGVQNVTHLFWPESAFPFILSKSPQALARIGKFLPRGAHLITGAARSAAGPSDRAGDQVYFNSIHILDADGLIVQTYDKRFLVPFGEFIPFDRFFRKIGLRQFVHIPGGFTAGPSIQEFTIPRLGPVIPLVCYEAIFPGASFLTQKKEIRPQLIVNVTNDGWFGPTFGPYQHFYQARLRSIEQGLPSVRVANTGISAVIDPVGRILHRLGLGVAGVIDSQLPVAASQTLFASYGSKIPLGIAFLFLIAALLFRRRSPLSS